MDSIGIDRFIERLVTIGYERLGQVEGIGQFAVRGGIVDIYPIGSDSAYRIEFFGDEIDSIRVFDCYTQRSIESIQMVVVLPATEYLIQPSDKKQMIACIRQNFDEYAKN